MTLNDYKREFLLHLVRTGAIRFGSFKLKSGRLSPYFINIADAMRTGSDAVKVANAYAARIKELDIEFDYIHGAAYKGIPLAALLAAKLSELGTGIGVEMDKRWGYDRKEEKRYGEEGAIVGELRDGDTVLIVDDVITTGATKVESWLKLASMRRDVKPAGILVAVDREETSDADKKMLARYQLSLYSILKITEIFKFLHNREIDGKVYVDDGMMRDFEQYFRQYAPETQC